MKNLHEINEKNLRKFRNARFNDSMEQVIYWLKNGKSPIITDYNGQSWQLKSKDGVNFSVYKVQG